MSDSMLSPADDLCDYKPIFDPMSFLNTFYAEITPSYNFYIRSLTHIVREKISQHRKGSKALDFGAGPCLWPSFLLAHYVDSVQICDYVPANLEVVQAWLDHPTNAFDWTKHFLHVLHEHQTPESELPKWQDDLRKALAHCPLSLCNALDPNCPILSGPANEYDIITSCDCLETACKTREQYKQVILRLMRLLKPGGLLVILQTFNCSFYIVENERFPCIPLDEQLAREALYEAGISPDQAFVHVEKTSDGTDPFSDHHGAMVISAIKPKS